MVYHPEALAKWHSLTLAEQMGNVGSEFERSVRAKHNHRLDRFERAFARMMELFDATVADPRWRGHRRRELARVREEVRELLCQGGRPAGSIEGMSRYFLAFATEARTRRA